MHFTKAFSLIATLAFGAVSFAAPLESANHNQLEARSCNCKTAPVYANDVLAAVLDLKATVNAGVSLATVAKINASLKVVADLLVEVKAGVKGYAGQTATTVWGAPPTSTMCHDMTAVYAQATAELYAIVKILATVDVTLQVLLNVNVQACVSAYNSLTAELELQLQATFVAIVGLGATFKACLTAILSITFNLTASICINLYICISLVLTIGGLLPKICVGLVF